MILKAEPQHIDLIHNVLRSCAQHLSAQGVDQWMTDYPDRSTIEADVAAGEAYVFLEGGRVVGCITVNEDQDPQYAQVDWQFPNPALVVHRLGVHPDSQGGGQAQQLMAHAEALAREGGFAAIRLDAYVGNPRSQAFYARRGYRRSGQVHFSYQRLPCTCFELRIEA